MCSPSEPLTRSLNLSSNLVTQLSKPWGQRVGRISKFPYELITATHQSRDTGVGVSRWPEGRTLANSQCPNHGEGSIREFWRWCWQDNLWKQGGGEEGQGAQIGFGKRGRGRQGKDFHTCRRVSFTIHGDLHHSKRH